MSMKGKQVEVLHTPVNYTLPLGSGVTIEAHIAGIDAGLSGIGGVPGAPDRSIQFNNSGAFEGSQQLLFRAASDKRELAIISNSSGTSFAGVRIEDSSTAEVAAFFYDETLGTAGEVSLSAEVPLSIGGADIVTVTGAPLVFDGGGGPEAWPLVAGTTGQVLAITAPGQMGWVDPEAVAGITAITTLNVGQSPLAVVGDDAPTGITVATIPSPNGDGTNEGFITVFVNGIQYDPGDGVKSGVVCYFTSDSGVTAKPLDAVAVNDELYWNGSVAGFSLSANDTVTLVYSVSGAAVAVSDVVSSEAELIALPFVTLSGSTIQVAQSFKVKGNVLLTSGRDISITASGVSIESVKDGQISGNVSGSNFLLTCAQADFRMKEMVLLNAGTGRGMSLSGADGFFEDTWFKLTTTTETAALVAGAARAEFVDCKFTGTVFQGSSGTELTFTDCSFTSGSRCVYLAAATEQTRFVACDFSPDAASYGIELVASRPLLVDGCVLKTGLALVALTDAASFINMTLTSNRVIGAAGSALLLAQLGATGVWTTEYLNISGNSCDHILIKADSSAGSTAAFNLYDGVMTGNRCGAAALIDNNIESTATYGFRVWDFVISNNIAVDGGTGILYHQRRACTSYWFEATISGNNLEAGGMIVDAGVNYGSTLSFSGNSIGDNYPLWVHRDTGANRTLNCSFTGNTLEGGGSFIGVHYPSGAGSAGPFGGIAVSGNSPGYLFTVLSGTYAAPMGSAIFMSANYSGISNTAGVDPDLTDFPSSKAAANFFANFG